MELKNCGLSAMTLKALEKKKIATAEQYMSVMPKGCDDYSRESVLSESVGRKALIIGTFMDYKVQNSTQPQRLTVNLVENSTGECFSVVWFSQNYREHQMRTLVGADIAVAGTVTYSPYYGYSMVSPDFFCRNEEFARKPYPRYGKISGVSDEMRTKLYGALGCYVPETLELPVLEKSELMDIHEVNRRLHFPGCREDYENALSQLRFRDMLYFASHMEQDGAEGIRMEPMRDRRLSDAYLSVLPFAFTDGQEKAADMIRAGFASGFASKSLVQGDVGCGKTAVAVYALMHAAGNGKQAVMMAPTMVLARQHYDGILEAAGKLNGMGFKVCPEFLSGNMTAKEKREAAKRIADGTSNIIIGTHSVLTEAYEYKELALVIVDEEHRFGVKQREALAERTKTGLHQILMSATPIPRTLAGAIYGDSTQIIEIKTLPSGRKPVQTAITASDSAVVKFVRKQLDEGRQAYIVCPLIENDDEDGGKGSVNEVMSRYRKELGNTVTMEAAHGRLKKSELEAVLNRFHKGETQVLVATTVVEVGVNVPNANVIVIENAELFGLATLHQLRGRVGRGTYDSYCILKSSDRDNPRLQLLTSTTDGFVIAEEDVKLRGTGNLIGLEQTGFDRYVSLSLEYPEEYARARKIAKWALGQGFTNMLKNQ